MKIVFFGSGEFGLPTLRALKAAHEVTLVVTQPDRPAGRNRVLTPTPVATWAEADGLPVIKPPKVNDLEVGWRIAEAEPDANVVVAFGQKIGDALIASPTHGRVATMNLHASLLPKYRGAAPIHWAVLRGEKETGNTVFSLVTHMDAGPILGAQRLAITPQDTTGDLLAKLAEMGPELVLEVLGKLERGELRPQVQDESKATLAPKLSRADAAADFHWTAEELRRCVHGLSPWPGVTVYFRKVGESEMGELKLLRLTVEQDWRGDAGVLKDGVIGTGSGGGRPVEVQPPGKRSMSWEGFLRGNALADGTEFTGLQGP